ncbi:MAG TPA: hypothetical protein VF941_08805 [Clostridia bacterium]
MFNKIILEENIKSALEFSLTKAELAKKIKDGFQTKAPIEIYNINDTSESTSAYYILDNSGNYAGQLTLNKTIWSYVSSSTPILAGNTKEFAIYNILMLQELAKLAGFNLNWFIVYGSEKDLIEVINEEPGKNQYISSYVPKGERLQTKEQYKELLWQFGKK